MKHSVKDVAASIHQRLLNKSKESGRPFNELLQYYAMERFLYRLSISTYVEKFFLKGGLLLKVWDNSEHRMTLDIDLLAKTSNTIDNLRQIIIKVSAIQSVEDAITFNTQKLILREAQTGCDYRGLNASFFAQLFKTRISYTS